MAKGVVLVCVAASFLGVALLLYQPLPDGIEDPCRVRVLMKLISIGYKLISFGKYLGLGSLHSNIWKLQKIERSGYPVSATYDDLKVINDIISGVQVIVYQPLDTSKLHPAIVFFHGGGWTILGVDSFHKTVYDYAVQTKAVVFNVGYRLAPGHPFPAPLQDCVDVTTFVLKHGAQYNVDVTKVGVVGDSAGGNLAAAVALKLHQEKTELPPLLFQVLHNPVLQGINTHLPSHVDYNQTMAILTLDMMCAFLAYYMGLDAENMDYYVQVISENRHIPPHVRNSKYAEYVDVKMLPEEYQTPKQLIPDVTSYDEKVYEKIKDIITNPLFSPLLAPDLAGLPPALIHVSEIDILRDDGLLYARRLQNAGVKVQVYIGKGGFHGDLIKLLPDFLQSSSGKKALLVAYSFIKEVLEQSNL